jgi:hypothetical protein
MATDARLTLTLLHTSRFIGCGCATWSRVFARRIRLGAFAECRASVCEQPTWQIDKKELAYG